jgi:hypothetical protein
VTESSLLSARCSQACARRHKLESGLPEWRRHVPDRAKTIDAELHAHAQQLLEFCREHDLGFVVMLVEPSKELHVVTNLNAQQKRAVAESWLDAPLRNSFHKPAVKV